MSDSSTQDGSKIVEAKNFFSSSITELKRVTFPTRRETTQATTVTIIIITVVSIFLFLADVVFSRIVGALLPG